MVDNLMGPRMVTDGYSFRIMQLIFNVIVMCILQHYILQHYIYGIIDQDHGYIMILPTWPRMERSEKKSQITVAYLVIPTPSAAETPSFDLGVDGELLIGDDG